MKKVSIIYWSKGGNVELLANIIGDELEKNDVEVNLKQVGIADLNDILEADAIAFGSPAMDNNRIEQNEMEPFIEQLEKLSVQKKVILFGTYGWGQCEFINEWEKRMKSFGFNVIGKLAVGEAPSDEQINELKDLSKNLINLE
ncbi:MAG: flavodoxin [Clostridium perfringens]|nr:flavodoxin [Clostridium perfringens]